MYCTVYYAHVFPFFSDVILSIFYICISAITIGAKQVNKQVVFSRASSVDHFSTTAMDWNIMYYKHIIPLLTLWLIAMKFHTHIHGLQRMSPNNFGDLLTLIKPMDCI